MAFDENIASRVRDSLSGVKGISEKKMFGGLCFMLDGKMVCGVDKDQLFLRVNPVDGEELLKKPGVRPFVHGGMSMKGFLLVDQSAFKTQNELEEWLKISLDFVSTLPAKKNK